jgi:hypothetical protein
MNVAAAIRRHGQRVHEAREPQGTRELAGAEVPEADRPVRPSGDDRLPIRGEDEVLHRPRLGIGQREPIPMGLEVPGVDGLTLADDQ